MQITDLKNYIIDVNDFPKKGIVFKDITPLLKDGQAFKFTISQMAYYAKNQGANLILGPESRGFIFATPVASVLNLGFVPIRKPGKLPRETLDENYDLEYGSNTLSIHLDSIKPGDRVVICDDLLATGGTIKAAINMVEKLGGKVVGLCFLIELLELKGREKIGNYPIFSLLKY